MFPLLVVQQLYRIMTLKQFALCVIKFQSTKFCAGIFNRLDLGSFDGRISFRVHTNARIVSLLILQFYKAQVSESDDE